VIETVATDRGPKAIGPYSQAVRANGFGISVWANSARPEDAADRGGRRGGANGTRHGNLKGVVEAAGSSLHRVGENHRVSGRYERFCGDERSVFALTSLRMPLRDPRLRCAAS